jgi:SanA protein
MRGFGRSPAHALESARLQKRRWLLRGLIAVAITGLAGLAAIGTANWWVLRLDVGLVLGTSPQLAGGWKNPFFEGRIASAATLYQLGRVKHLLVSGDNGRKSYDEPSAMRDALIARGVPAGAITLDYAGFRTLDSMVRAKSVFGLQRVTVITDDFHQPRAIFLARASGLDAFGFPSGHVPFRWSKKTRTREVVSRLKACLDIYVFHTQPKFLGPLVAIRIAGDPAP